MSRNSEIVTAGPASTEIYVDGAGPGSARQGVLHVPRY